MARIFPNEVEMYRNWQKSTEMFENPCNSLNIKGFSDLPYNLRYLLGCVVVLTALDEVAQPGVYFEPRLEELQGGGRTVLWQVEHGEL